MAPTSWQNKQRLPGILKIIEGDETKEMILFYDLFNKAASNPQVMQPDKRNNDYLEFWK